MKNSIFKITKTDLLPLFVLLTLGLQGFGLIWLFANTAAIFRLATKPIPSLVQLKDGRAIKVTAWGSRERTPLTIRRFVGENLALMLNMSGELPPEKPESDLTPQRDPGHELSNNKLVTTASWQASFAVSEDYRAELLKLVAQLTPKELFMGNTKVVLITRYLSDPEEIASGQWKLKVIGDLLYISATDKAGYSTPFNKEIFVRVVDPPVTPLEDSASTLEKTIYSVRQAGLEIYGMRQLEKNNL